MPWGAIGTADMPHAYNKKEWNNTYDLLVPKNTKEGVSISAHPFVNIKPLLNVKLLADIYRQVPVVIVEAESLVGKSSLERPAYVCLFRPKIGLKTTPLVLFHPNPLHISKKSLPLQPKVAKTRMTSTDFW